ncbi:hypothetical protein [Thiomicrorhabdus sediminis]|uniref:Uncharacterized protein n=1 Tax=Thiomicrorhabdus sediminis TaxID=2580412 RepID=A0A4P9K7P1_9GAMM|nr:hypothetical protein [Thiomicrorhabdus sediminis]QCU90257.1 hypothetical protein FE785_06235 [Thiomicrorhabdus sediminis]
MPNIESLKPIKEFAEQYAPKLGIKPNSIKVTIDRNQAELIELGAVFKSRGKSRLINPEKFFEWYMEH